MLAGVFHFSFTVSDLDRSVVWYTDVLGMELVHRQVQDNGYTRTLVGLPDAALEIAQLALPGIDPGASTHVLELVAYRTPPGARLDLATQNVGVAHLAFLVDDISERHRRMRARGVAFVSAPVAITEGANRGGFTCYFRDPDGITLEMLQPSAERLRAIACARVAS
ncbi:MAG: VOC family protein [Solirubrobacteraceae bacterium]|jgi:catechol 2,3-dioxygenase-like lactoylglutathione lyase family enzyme